MEENNLALEVLKQMKESHTQVVKRLITALIIITILFIGTNVFWIIKSYEPVDTTTSSYDIDSKDNGNAIYNEDGKVNVNGKDKSK